MPEVVLGSRWQCRETGEVLTVVDYNMTIVVVSGEHERPSGSFMFRLTYGEISRGYFEIEH